MSLCRPWVHPLFLGFFFYVAVKSLVAQFIYFRQSFAIFQLFTENKLYKAHYLLLNVECEQNALTELTNSFKFNDAVIRNLITNCDKAITEPSVFMQNKDNKDSEKNNAYYDARTTSPEAEESVVAADLEIDPEI